MDPRTEPIRQDIDSIRDSMTEKMEQIEAKVRNTVDTTTDSVKHMFDIKQQVSERPWTAFGLSVLAGFALGSLGGGSEYATPRPGEAMQYYPGSSDYRRSSSSSSNPYYGSSASYTSSRTSAHSMAQQPGTMSDVFGQFGEELSLMKTAAMSSLVTLLRDTIRQNLPQFGDEYERLRNERSAEAESAGVHAPGLHSPAMSTQSDPAYGSSPSGLGSSRPVSATTGSDQPRSVGNLQGSGSSIS